MIMNKILSFKYFKDRFANSLEESVVLVGGRRLRVELIFDCMPHNLPVFSVLLNDIWVGNVSYEQEFDVLYKIMTGVDLITMEEFRKRNP